jgi:hypothetical protein
LTGEWVPIATANAEGRAFVEAKWGTLRERLSVVSGKRLIGLVRTQIQDQHGVNFGNERLAEAFEASEIPAEIVDVLNQVAALVPPPPVDSPNQ